MNTFLVFKDVHGDDVRININNIAYYTSFGTYTVFHTSGDEVVSVQTSIEEVDRMLSESYCYLKPSS